MFFEKLKEILKRIWAFVIKIALTIKDFAIKVFEKSKPIVKKVWAFIKKIALIIKDFAIKVFEKSKPIAKKVWAFIKKIALIVKDFAIKVFEKSKKINKKKILNILFIILVAIFVLIIVLALASKITGKNLLPLKVVWVLTDSMQDTFEEKSYILVSVCDKTKIKNGDIISFYSRDPGIYGSLNTHRVIEVIKEGEEFLTKGDSNLLPDKYTVYADDVYAKYVCNLNVLTFFGRLYSSKQGFVITIVFLSVLILAFGYFFIKNADKIDKIEKQKQIDLLVQQEVERLKEEAKNKENNKKE